MMTARIIFKTLFILLFFCLSVYSVENTDQNTSKSKIPESTYAGMRWRLVGPFRAGWATVSAGIPGSPNTYYFGSAGGGVWKTVDAGRTWQALMQQESAAAIGALAVAPSDSQTIYAGTGQVTIRYDDMAGDGVFKSTDGGNTWQNVGLKETRHIGSILVDPHDANRVLVAALGHAFGPNPERGLYLTKDGGKNWDKVLFVNDKTGFVDLAADPFHPQIIYAAAWQMYMHPWLDYFQDQAGPGSGIYKSTDGGEHWQKLKCKGIPEGDLGRIGLGVPRGSDGQRVYATVIVPKGKSGLYRSDDSGANWALVNKDPEIANDYFSRITVSPKNPDILFIMGRSIHRSNDGGHHFTIPKGSPGGDDYHFLWINPGDTTHMISASDQGACVTVNGGATWSSWYNQPTGQFYHLAADDRFPYHIYSGQQDNGTVEIASQGPYGVIEERDWHPVGGDERDYMVPKPGNPDVVFGSGLGGYVSRFDNRTRQVANVSPWPVSSYGARLNEVRYRYSWITPLEFSPFEPHAMYFASQYLFRSLDDGDNWQIVSPDLSAKKKDAGDCQDPDLQTAKDCGFGVIFTIAPSSKDKNVIWTGTDDGLLHVSLDNCKTWTNVTPDNIPAWGKISAIAPSPFSAKTAYVAVDLHRIDIFKPLVLKTADGGKSWQTIINGLPQNEFVDVVRCDTEREGLLFAGSNRSVYISFNDGENWQPLGLNFPTAWVRDLLVHKNDLIAGTQGHAIWALSDLSPLREVSASLAEENVHLFKPALAWRMRGNENHDTPPSPSTPLGQNPHNGAMIDYWLNDAAKSEVTLTISDVAGKVVRQFSSNDKPEKLTVNRYFQVGWLGNSSQLSTQPGMHRFVWDLRYPRTTALHYSYSIAAVWFDKTPIKPEGPLALPGTYTVMLKVDGKEYKQSLVIKLDPRVNVGEKALQEQLDLAQKINGVLGNVVSSYNEIKQVLKDKKDQLQTGIVDSLTSIADKGKPNLSGMSGVLASLDNAVQSADTAPTQGQKSVFEEYSKQVDGLVKRWQKIKSTVSTK